jgi:type I restriction enzyme M protein
MKNKTYYGNDVAFVKTDNLHDNIIKDNFKDYLSTKGNSLISGTELQVGDVLITIIGATFGVVPRSSIVKKDILPANINQNIALIRVDSTKTYPEYISTYLNTQHGKTYLRYLARQTGQVNLNCREVEDVVVPLFSKDFQCTIANIAKSAYKCQDEAKKLYADAEIFLLYECGISNFIPTQSLFTIKGVADSFFSSGRIDSEYYQAKYEEILQKISGTNCDTLENLVWIKKSIEPGSDEYIDEGIPFVRVADLTKYGITATEKHLARIPFANMDLQPKKDTVLLSKDGTVGIAYKAEEDLDVVTSGAILHLTTKDKRILPDYLALVLNSLVAQMQAERDTGGSIIQHWRPSEIEKVIIPLIDSETQQQIADLIQESFALRRESERLLDLAKRAVEVAIEQGEDEAVEMLGGANNE